MKSILRASEFWVAVVGVVSVISEKAGWLPKEVITQWAPGIVTYILARITSKAAKKLNP